MEIISKSVKDTKNIGEVVAKHLRPADIICLFGQLGSGKTMLTKGIARGLKIRESKVISPSFVLIREHSEGILPLYHFDLYRLKNECEIVTIGYEEYLYDDGVSVIEWADRLKSLMPRHFLKIELIFNPGLQRKIKFSAFGLRYEGLLKEMGSELFFSEVILKKNNSDPIST